MVSIEKQIKKLHNSLLEDCIKYDHLNKKQKMKMEKKYKLLKDMPRITGKNSATIAQRREMLCERYELCRIIYQDDINVFILWTGYEK